MPRIRPSSSGLVVALTAASVLLGACSNDSGLSPLEARAANDNQPLFVDEPPATPVENPPVPVGRWVPTDYSASEGYFTNIFGSDPAWFDLNEDGSVQGFTGCGSFSGQFMVSGGYTEPGTTITSDDDGQAIEFSILEDDPTGCDEGFASEQHRDLIANLDNADRWVDLGGGTVIVRDAVGGNSIVSTREG